MATNILTLDIDAKGAVKSTADLAKAVEQASKELKGIEENTGKTSEAYVQQQAKLKVLQKEYRTNSRLVQNLTEVNTGQIKTIKQARTALSAVSQQWAQQASLYGENSEEANKLAEQKKQLTDLLEQEEKKTGDARRGVGKYAEGIKEALGGNMSFTDSLGGLGEKFPIVSKAAGGLNKMFNLLLANPIGLIIAAIVLALTGLVKLFGDSEEGAAVFNEVMAVVGATIDFVAGILRNFTKDLWAFLKGEKDISELGDAFTGLGDKFEKAMDQAKAIAALETSIKKLNIFVQKSTADLDAMAAKLQAVADDATLSFKAQEDAAKKLEETQTESARQRLSLANKELELQNLLLQQAKDNGKFSEELLKAQADAYSAQVQAESDLYTVVYENDQRQRQLKQDRLEKDLDILIDGYDNVKTINEKIINSDKETLDNRQTLLDETVRLGNESFDKQIETIQQFTNKSVDANALLQESNSTVLNERIRELGLSEIIEGRLLEVIRDRRTALSDFAETLQALNDTRVEDAQRVADLELEIERTNLANKLEIVEQYGVEELSLKQQQLQLDYEAEIANAEKIGADKQLIQEKYRQQNQSLNDAQRLLELEKDIIQSENDLELQKIRGFETFNQDRELLEAQYDYDKERALQQGEDLTLIDARYSAQKRAIAKQEQDFKIGLAQGALSNIATIFGEESKVGQAAAAANTIIDGTKGAISAYSSLAGIPVVGPVLGAAAAGAVGVQTASAVRKIYATKPGAKASSTSISGASGASATGSVTSSDGGNLASLQNQAIDNNIEGVKIAFSEALQENPNVVVIEEIDRVQNQRDVIVTDSEI